MTGDELGQAFHYLALVNSFLVVMGAAVVFVHNLRTSKKIDAAHSELSDIHGLINSRMDDWIAAVKAEAYAAGVADTKAATVKVAHSLMEQELAKKDDKSE